MGELAPH